MLASFFCFFVFFFFFLELYFCGVIDVMHMHVCLCTNNALVYGLICNVDEVPWR